MISSSVALYHQTLWSSCYVYRATLILLRMAELGLITARFLLFRAPLLIALTRLPHIKNMRMPYGELAKILGPARDRPALLAGTIIPGMETIGNCKTKEDIVLLQQLSRSCEGNSHSTAKIILGGMIRGLLIELGPIFIKFGQILSMRPETPSFLREEFQLLQDHIPPISPKVTRRCLKAELHRPIEEVFQHVDWTPIATGSLAQVHRAVFLDGQQVALKIQRPHLKGAVTIDSVIILDCVLAFFRLLLPLIRQMDLAVFTSSFRKSLRRETDFFLEARTQDRFYNLIACHPIYSQTIKIARIHWQYTTSKLIVMEYVDGRVRMDHLLQMDTDKLYNLSMYKIPQYPHNQPFHLFLSTAAFWGEMILHWGLIHGDPHLGNLYAVEVEENKWKTFVCDFGMIDELSEEGLRWTNDLFAGLLLFHDAEMLVDTFTQHTRQYPKRMAKVDMDLVHAVCNRWLDRRAVQDDCNGEITLSLQRHGGSSVTSEIMWELVQTPHLRQPEWAWLVIKSLAYLEELAIILWCDYNAADMFTPYIRVAAKNRMPRQIQNLDVTNADGHMEQPELLHCPDTAQLTANTETTFM